MDALHIKTPVFYSIPMSKTSGHNVFLKMDCYQPTGSFKIRGIGALCQEWVARGKTQLVSSSGGNAGYATAYAGKKLGVPVTVFVPKSTRPIYLQAIEATGAKVELAGEVWDEANEIALAYAKKIDAGFVPPFDHFTIWKGNSTLIDEVVTQMEKPDAIIASVGGGGLACGILEGLHRHGWEKIPLFAVETKGAASFAAAEKAHHLVTLPKVDTIATTLAAKRVTQALLDWTQQHRIISLTVTDAQTVNACRHFLDDHRALVEPACGAALSLAYDRTPDLNDFKNILIIVCGGIGISFELLQEYLKKR